jgi:hypothetical protein
MIYIDTNPGLELDLLEQAYSTFAHELQHLINFVTSNIKNRGLMDTWVDEGLSSQAEYLYLGKNPGNKIEWFSTKSKTIPSGNNFFVWDNYPKDNQAILDEYATVYLFFRWLYLKYNEVQPSIFLDIITSAFSDHQAITGVTGYSWETLLRNWFYANYFPENGYIGDDYLRGPNGVKARTTTGSSRELYPGEGVYSLSPQNFESVSSGFIRYAGLNAGGINTIATTAPYSACVLLTFNANTNKGANPEIGRLTGHAAVPRAITTETYTGQYTGPYVLDARDVLGRHREQELPGIIRKK